jgi:hypothetical protein
MADGSLYAWWCCALGWALALVAADGFLVDITYVESAVAKGAGESSCSSSSSSPIYPYHVLSQRAVSVLWKSKDLMRLCLMDVFVPSVFGW